MPTRYPTEPLQCWQKAKELQRQYYRRYFDPTTYPGIRWAGGAWSFTAIPAGLGDDVYSLAGEPYAAMVAHNKSYSRMCLEAAEERGWSRDLCSYMKNYWGSMYLGKSVWGDPWVRPDFLFQTHICSSHAKWYQHCAEYESVPYFVVDVSVGPYQKRTPHKIKYIREQLLESIAFMEHHTKRTYNVERLQHAVKQEMEASHLWAKICMLNQHIPAPLEEKSMYTLYSFGALARHDPEFLIFYRELYDEVQERVKQGIAAVPNEDIRFVTDTQPPWGFLQLYRFLQENHAVVIGSLYTFGLIGIWDFTNNQLVPMAPLPVPSDLDGILDTLIQWNLARPLWQHFYDPSIKSQMMQRLVNDWNAQGVLLHLNRGCEGLSCGVMENRNDLHGNHIPVFSFEGNMADEREFDLERVKRQLLLFIDRYNKPTTG